MKEFKSIDDILDFAIQSEQDAVDFYKGLAANAKSSDMRDVFEQFAREEISHKARIKKVKEEGFFEIEKEDIADLHISDYVVSVTPSPDMSYRDALIVAMKKEKAAYKLYIRLSERAPSKELKELFMALAIEESKHKLRFEIEYDEHVLREN